MSGIPVGDQFWQSAYQQHTHRDFITFLQSDCKAGLDANWHDLQHAVSVVFAQLQMMLVSTI